MERFAKRKLVILKNCDEWRVFLKGDDGRIFHIGDYPKSWPKDMIEYHAKEDYNKLKIINTKQSKYKIVACLKAEMPDYWPIVDEQNHIMFFDTRESAMNWIEKNLPEKSQVDYVIVEEGES